MIIDCYAPGIACPRAPLALTSEYITLSRRALSSSEMAACGGGWSTAPVPEERPALDGGASDSAGSAVGSGRAVSDMIDTELSSVQGEDAEYGGGEGNSQATKPPQLV